VRFVDFGAARFRGMKESGQDRGTLPFVAPEVARGEEPPSAAGDVYALCATLLFLSLGRPLATSPDEAAMLLEIGERGLRAEMIEEAPGLTGAERAALRRALSPDRSLRPETARELLLAMGPSGRG
jgi:eukaryotic-like serine/threonine-protein kinase